MTGVQARSQVTNALMRIPPNAVDAGTACGTGAGSPPVTQGADMPCTLGKRDPLGDTSDSSMPPSIPGSYCHLCREQPKPRRAKMHNDRPTNQPTNGGLQHQLQPDNTSPLLGSREDSGNQGSPQPCQRQGDINWGIQQRLGEFPLLLPTKIQPPPILQGALSMKHLTTRVSSA